MDYKISLLMHGPADRSWLDKICTEIKKASFSFEKIVIVSYVTDLEKYANLLAENGVSDLIELVPCKDTLNPGFFNVNRQIKTVHTGLQRLPQDAYVIKMRSDQSIDFNKIFPYLEKIKEHAILTTNCFTRSDRLFHPSDMLLCARWIDMNRYFSAPYMNNTHEAHIMQERLLYENTDRKSTALQVTPESYLFRTYLEGLGWETQETKDDSLASLRKYIYLINSWDIDYRWKESRTPYLSGSSLILPYYMDMRPFEGGPLERCRCIHRHTLQQTKPTFKDLYYINLSKVLFTLKYSNPLKSRKYWLKYKYYGLMNLFASLLPYFLSNKWIEKLKRKRQRAKDKYRQTL
ncbi:MAG: hypothetical protein ACRCWR_02670 [Saezia sp.]